MRSTVALVLFAFVATFFSPLAARPAAAATSGVPHNVVLHDLAARRQVWTSSVVQTSASIGFSPHGRYLIYSAITAPLHVQLSIVDAVAGAAHRYFTEFNVFPGFGVPGDVVNA